MEKPQIEIEPRRRFWRWSQRSQLNEDLNKKDSGEERTSDLIADSGGEKISDLESNFNEAESLNEKGKNNAENENSLAGSLESLDLEEELLQCVMEVNETTEEKQSVEEENCTFPVHDTENDSTIDPIEDDS